MTVLFITNFVPRKRGGFEHLLVALDADLKRRGHRLVLALSGQPVGGARELLCAQHTEATDDRRLKTEDLAEDGVQKVGASVVGRQSSVAERSDASLEWRVIPGWTMDYGPRTMDSEERSKVQCLTSNVATASAVAPWAMVRPVLRLIRELKPDVCVVHFGNELPSLVALWLSRLMGSRAKWVWQQDQQIASPSTLASHVSRIRALCLGFSRFVAVSELGKCSMVARRVPPRRVVVIPNSAPQAQTMDHGPWTMDHGPWTMDNGQWTMDPSSPRLRGAGDGERSKVQGLMANVKPHGLPVVVTVSSLIRRKRLDVAIDAVALANAAGHACSLVVVGDGELHDELTQYAERCGVDVVFLGLRDDVPALLSQADVYLHTADAEGCCYAILESMAAGLPAVVTDCGAAREQVVDGVSGFVVPCGDAARVADRLVELLSDAARRDAFGVAAKERWQAEFRTEVAASRYADLYESL